MHSHRCQDKLKRGGKVGIGEAETTETLQNICFGHSWANSCSRRSLGFFFLFSKALVDSATILLDG